MVWNIAFYKRGGFDRGDGDTLCLFFFFFFSFRHIISILVICIFPGSSPLRFCPRLSNSHATRKEIPLSYRLRDIPIVQLKINVSMVIALAALGYPCMWGWI